MNLLIQILKVVFQVLGGIECGLLIEYFNILTNCLPPLLILIYFNVNSFVITVTVWRCTMWVKLSHFNMVLEKI